MNVASGKYITLDSLVIGYPGNVLLPPLNAVIARGEIVSVIGHNGVGKSTLLSILAGITTPLGGSVIFGNRRIENIGRREMALIAGYVSTSMVNAPNMRIADLVAIGRFPHTNWLGRLTVSDRQHINRAIDLVGLTKLAQRYVSELSDGERQRAMIARVLAQDTAILILDEPTSFLDIRNRNELLQLLHRLSREEGKTILISTHDLQSAIGESDKLWLLTSDGLTEGAPEDMVLSGTLAKMYAGDNVKFKRSDGTFFTERREKGVVEVEGSGLQAQWTIRALRRLGFRQPDGKSPASFIVICTTEGRWIVKRQDSQTVFTSIYDLAGYADSLS